MNNSMEQHDKIYRQAYRDYLNNDLESARKLAMLAVTKAQEFHERRCQAGIDKPFCCRAMTLLHEIEWRSLLAQKQ